jgi:hypothetical protein
VPEGPRILSDGNAEPRLIPTVYLSRDEPLPFPSLTIALLPVFAEYMACDEATRSAATGSRQELPLRGTFITYQPSGHGFRASDRTQRIYVSVRAYEELGETNHEACRAVAALWEQRIGRSGRGRPRATTRPRDFLDTVQTVRSVYHHVRSRNPFVAARPQRDLLYESWLGRFWFWYRWVTAFLLRAVLKAQSGKTFAEELLARPDTAPIHRTLARFSGASLCTMLDSVVGEYQWPEDIEAKLSPKNIEDFIGQFLAASLYAG